MKLQKLFVVGTSVENCEVFFDLQSAIDSAKQTIKDLAFSSEVKSIQYQLDICRRNGFKDGIFTCEIDSGKDQPKTFSIKVVDVPVKLQ